MLNLKILCCFKSVMKNEKKIEILRKTNGVCTLSQKLINRKYFRLSPNINIYLFILAYVQQTAIYKI